MSGRIPARSMSFRLGGVVAIVLLCAGLDLHPAAAGITAARPGPAALSTEDFGLVPRPRSVRPAAGSFALEGSVIVTAGPGAESLAGAAGLLAAVLREASGMDISVSAERNANPPQAAIDTLEKCPDRPGQEAPRAGTIMGTPPPYESLNGEDSLNAGRSASRASRSTSADTQEPPSPTVDRTVPLPREIRLSLDPDLASVGDEAYRLRIAADSVSLAAPKPAGILHGIQTIRQLAASDGGASLPCGEIEDAPAFAWRGLLLDCSRHFLSVGTIERVIDLLAYHKLNVLHWHLTDDQGWRVEIKRYPRLTEIGAWRLEHGQRYGGFYTQDQVRGLVAYAAARGITIVPEIEMPGHALAAIAAYPSLSCTGHPVGVAADWGIYSDVFCPGKESTFEFVENLLAEVCELFPSPYIHLGGDECPKSNWNDCPDCARRMREEKLKDAEALQGWFTARVERILRTRGRRLIGWDEILAGGVTPTAVVQSWRGLDGALAAARQGNRVISSPVRPTYLVLPQVPEELQAHQKTVNTLSAAYAFDPVPAGLTPEQAALVMGGEGCLWGEWTYDFEVEPQLFPRLCALAEALWTPREGRDFAAFQARMAAHERRLLALGVDVHRPEVVAGTWTPGKVTWTFNPLPFDVSAHVNGDGIHRIGVVQTAGQDDLVIPYVELYRNGELAARHDKVHRTRVDLLIRFPLRVTGHSPGDRYTLRVAMARSGPGHSDSAGRILLRKFQDTGLDIR